MRKILFKAKLKDWKIDSMKNKWIIGYYVSRKETTYCFTEDYEKYPVKTLHFIIADEMTDWGMPNQFRFYEIDPDTLCAFTGLTDKNDNKIWENDVVWICKTDRAIVIFSEKHSGYILQPIEDYYFDSPILADNVDIIDNIIGNIFDNPELINSQS